MHNSSIIYPRLLFRSFFQCHFELSESKAKSGGSGPKEKLFFYSENSLGTFHRPGNGRIEYVGVLGSKIETGNKGEVGGPYFFAEEKKERDHKLF